MDMKRFTDQVAIITGAASGIGKACAMKLADAGATVILVARNAEKLEATQRDILRDRDIWRVRFWRGMAWSLGD